MDNEAVIRELLKAKDALNRALAAGHAFSIPNTPWSCIVHAQAQITVAIEQLEQPARGAES